MPAVLRHVLGRTPPMAAAQLRGFRRRRLTGQRYPAIIADPEESVEGALICGLTEQDWDLLDLYEGDLYERIPVQVSGDAGAYQAQTYALRPSLAHLLDGARWSLEHFERHDLEAFLSELDD